jgi:hypothetical protein
MHFFHHIHCELAASRSETESWKRVPVFKLYRHTSCIHFGVVWEVNNQLHAHAVFTSQERNPRYSLHSKLGESQSHSEKNDEDTNSIAPAGHKKWQTRRQPTILFTDLERAEFIKNVRRYSWGKTTSESHNSQHFPKNRRNSISSIRPQMLHLPLYTCTAYRQIKYVSRVNMQFFRRYAGLRHERYTKRAT